MFFFFQNILLFFLSIPFVSCFFLILFYFKISKKKFKNIILNITSFIFFFNIILFLLFDKTSVYFQHIHLINYSLLLNINLIIGIDGISIFFLLLTTFLIPLCLISSWNSIEHNIKFFFFNFLLLEGCLLIIFCVLDLFFFYIFFESILIPMFLLIGLWGSRQRKIKANYYFFFLTLIGSLLLLLAIISIYIETGSSNYLTLLLYQFDFSKQCIYWVAFFISFAIKVPIMPFHLWLPEAHVEAPTAGSILLAGVLLKLGSYGILRFIIPLFPEASYYFTPIIFIFCSISTVYASLIAIRQIDLKRIIAYASIAHMNLIILGLFSFNIQGFEGSIFQMISHGITASALFFSIGLIYDKYHTRNLLYYGGLCSVMPLFTFFFLIYTFANIALPLTCNFIGEFLILISLIQINSFITIIGATGMILSGVYSLWLLNRLCFGNLKTIYITYYSDICIKDIFMHIPFVSLIIFLGVFPNYILSTIRGSLYFILYIINQKL